MNKTLLIKSIYQRNQNKLKKYKRLELLKEIEEIVNKEIIKSTELEEFRNSLGEDNKKLLLSAVLDSDFQKCKEYSPLFYKLYKKATFKQEIMRFFISKELIKTNRGFSQEELIILQMYLKISKVYDKYYISWAKFFRNSSSAKNILNEIKTKGIKNNTILNSQDFINNYTVNIFKEGKYHTYTYYYLFKKYFENFNKYLLDASQSLENIASENSIKYAKYLRQIAKSLMCEDKTIIEKEWEKVDVLWMDIKTDFQIVHDIETGYADPLRTKVIPEFSLRILDNKYVNENKIIEEIRVWLLNDLKKRETQLSGEAIKAISNSFAGIYYVPIHTGMAYHFRFSGQSIPNRINIRTEKGIKIFFDPVSTEIRTVSTKKLAEKVLLDKTLTSKINSIEQIVMHVAAHEFGHAIYGLNSLGNIITKETASLLEETRADLTSLYLISKWSKLNRLSNQEVINCMINYSLADLRRFSSFNNEVTKAYTISAMYTYKIYEKTGFMQILNNKLIFDFSKVYEVLNIFENKYLEILDMEDRKDIKGLESVLKDFMQEATIVTSLVNLLNKK